MECVTSTHSKEGEGEGGVRMRGRREEEESVTKVRGGGVKERESEGKCVRERCKEEGRNEERKRERERERESRVSFVYSCGSYYSLRLVETYHPWIAESHLHPAGTPHPVFFRLLNIWSYDSCHRNVYSHRGISHKRNSSKNATCPYFPILINMTSNTLGIYST